MLKCVAFDMDDTLYDELDYYQSGLAAVASVIAGDYQFAEETVFDALWDIFIQGNHKTAFNETLDRFVISYGPDYIGRLVNVLRCHTPRIHLPADSKAVLEALKSNYRLALITDGFLPAQQLKVQALGIEQDFDVVIFTEALGRQFWKPSTVAFEMMLDKMALRPQECVYVGDNLEKDFIAPNKLGFKTVQLIRENRFHTSTSQEELAKAQYEIDCISKLPELLEQIDV